MNYRLDLQDQAHHTEGWTVSPGDRSFSVEERQAHSVEAKPAQGHSHMKVAFSQPTASREGQQESYEHPNPVAGYVAHREEWI